MWESFATALVGFTGVYLAVGIVFSIPFLMRGVNRIDPVAAESTRGFRIVILPGVVALWPLLLKRWLSGSGGPPEQCDAHRAAARGRPARGGER